MANLIVGVNNLATVNPKLAKEWNYEKNDKLPQEYTSGSCQKVWWKCKENHEWQATINSRTREYGCPYCAGQRVIIGENDLATVNPELAKEWNYEKNYPFTPKQIMGVSGKNVWWKCDKGHEWRSKVSDRSRGNGCPYCSNKKVLKGFNDLETINPILCKEWNYEKNDTLPTEYTFCSGQKVWWKCSKGHEWQASIAHRKGGEKCPYCTNRKVIKGFNDLATTHPELVKEWNYEKNGTLTPDTITFGSERKVWWLGKCGHTWRTDIGHRVHGVNCPYCSGNKVLQGFNDLKTKNPLLAKEWNYNKNGNLKPTDITRCFTKKVWWLCQEGHEWQAVVASRNSGVGCPYCSGSKAERLTYKILKEWNIPFRAEKKFEQDIRVKYYPYDVWISKVGLLIELDGMQHFQYFEGYFEQGVPFEKRVEHDNIKNQFAFEKRIPLLRIPYTYNPDTEEEKIRQILKEFIETRKIPQEIIEYYEQYDFSNYSQIAKEMNEL